MSLLSSIGSQLSISMPSTCRAAFWSPPTFLCLSIARRVMKLMVFACLLVSAVILSRFFPLLKSRHGLICLPRHLFYIESLHARFSHRINESVRWRKGCRCGFLGTIRMMKPIHSYFLSDNQDDKTLFLVLLLYKITRLHFPLNLSPSPLQRQLPRPRFVSTDSCYKTNH